MNARSTLQRDMGWSEVCDLPTDLQSLPSLLRLVLPTIRFDFLPTWTGCLERGHILVTQVPDNRLSKGRQHVGFVYDPNRGRSHPSQPPTVAIPHQNSCPPRTGRFAMFDLLSFHGNVRSKRPSRQQTNCGVEFAIRTGLSEPIAERWVHGASSTCCYKAGPALRWLEGFTLALPNRGL